MEAAPDVRWYPERERDGHAFGRFQNLAWTALRVDHIRRVTGVVVVPSTFQWMWRDVNFDAGFIDDVHTANDYVRWAARPSTCWP